MSFSLPPHPDPYNLNLFLIDIWITTEGKGEQDKGVVRDIGRHIVSRKNVHNHITDRRGREDQTEQVSSGVTSIPTKQVSPYNSKSTIVPLWYTSVPSRILPNPSTISSGVTSYFLFFCLSTW